MCKSCRREPSESQAKSARAPDRSFELLFYADLHIHSKFSRATSKSCDLEHLALWARSKGLSVLATGDFTHPGWMAELEEQLIPAGPGAFALRPDLEAEVERRLPGACHGLTRFVLSVEISTIYKKADRTRKVHHVVYAPDFESARRLTHQLSKVGNLSSDGRPILGLDSRDLLEMVLSSGEGCYLVPAHVWTPWFSVLGSKSGFDSVAECYGDLADHIFALETGLSSDPPMNWKVSSLDRYRLVSNSDAHSPEVLGREACVFDTEPDYFSIRAALQSGNGYVGTVEFFPEEGKYHLDGHRKCGVKLTPEQTRQCGDRCPVCGKPVTVGVMNRVEELADRGDRELRPETAGEVYSLVPLREILSEIEGVGAKSKRVMRAYQQLVSRLGPELVILNDLPLEEIQHAGSSLLDEAIRRLREGRVIRDAGFDGEYGVIRLFDRDEISCRQKGGFLFSVRRDNREHREVQSPSRPSPPEHSAEPRARDRQEKVCAGGGSAVVGSGPLSGLDPEQRAAAETVSGPVLIVAGPGSGKTRTLTHRLAHLVQDHGASPEQCLAITFTRRAATEMRERLGALLPEVATGVPVFTFHALGLSMLQEHGSRVGLQAGFRLAEQRESAAFVTEFAGISPRKAARLLQAISRLKRTGAAGGLTASGEADDAELASAYRVYDQQMKAHGLLDYDDLVVLAVQLLRDNAQLQIAYQQRYKWISIDEYQDVDQQQYALVKLLAPADGNLCVIGDPDQAIYGFRGSDLRFFRRFQEDFPGARVFSLTRNYRSGRPIVEASSEVMAQHRSGEQTAAIALLESPERIVLHEAATDRAEAEFVVHTLEQMIGGHSFFSIDSGRSAAADAADLSFSDFAVLYRSDAVSHLVCEALARSGMPFQKLSHARLSELPGVVAILDHLGQADGSAPLCEPAKAPSAHRGSIFVRAKLDLAVAAALQQCSAKAPSADRRQIEAASELLTPMADACGQDLGRFRSELIMGGQVDAWDPRADRVSVLTMHAAKGLEFRVVFILGCEKGILPLSWDGDDPESVSEERRLFYVGMSRARDRLFLCRARRRAWRGKVRSQAPSPFVLDIRDELMDRRASTSKPGRKRGAGEQLNLF